MSTNSCKFCGAGQQGEDTLGYQCASWRYREIDYWVQSAVCQQRSLELRLRHEQTIEVLQKRIAAAIEVSQRVIRFGLEANSTIRCVFAADMDRVIEILEANSPENPEGSP